MGAQTRDGRRGPRRAARLAGLVATAMVLAAAACSPRVTPLDPAFAAGMLTSEGGDTYGLRQADGVVTVSAASSNTGNNTRMAFWRTAGGASTDQESCGTWQPSASPGRQHGAVLRARTVNGRTSAITITNNVLFGGRWGFNVHVMDSGMSPAFRQIGGFDLREAFLADPVDHTVVPLPWRMCARVVGDVVSFVVWPTGQAQPQWGDARHGGSVQLPEGWSTAGRPGWYLGHLEAGYSATFTDLAGGALGTTEARRGVELQSSGRIEVRRPTWIASAP